VHRKGYPQEIEQSTAAVVRRLCNSNILQKTERIMSKLRICVAGATGWAGSALSRGIFEASDMELVSAVSRTHAGKTLDKVIGIEGLTTPIFATVPEALQAGPNVFVEYTKPEVAKSSIVSALKSGAHVVVGTSGLSHEDYDEIDRIANEIRRGVLAVGNFALTVVLLQKFAEMAAKYIPHWEIIDYAHASKKDAPSGTARELANRLSKVQETKLEVSLDQIDGLRESRGARLEGTQVHSVRLPGYVISIDAIFGMPGQTLILRHESGSSAEPYVNGALLAIREVGKLIGVHRGLDSVMEF
jgi:4-hydroxy-tetrahydrodipicolinate reductase